MKYTDPSEFFKFIIEKSNIDVVNDSQKCLALALDLLDSEKNYFNLLKISFIFNVYKELIKVNKSDSSAKTLIKSILKRGANITQKDSYSGEYLLDIARRNPNPKVLKTIESNLPVSTTSIETRQSWNVSNSNNYYTTSRDNNYYESTSYVPNNSPSKNNNDFNNGCANGCGCLIWLLIFAACQGCMFLK